jgi:spore coat polysaccharide biosynthesis protein SpsF (cytidylyltransferase family)
MIRKASASALVIIQARSSSTRFPRKVLQLLGETPMLISQIARARKIKNVLNVVIATSVERSDDELAAVCAKHSVPVFRGSEQDVLKRFLDAALLFVKTEGLTDDIKLVRLTGDCPLIDPKIIDRSLAALSPELDYIGYDYSLPDGLDCESFWLSTLAKADQEAKKSSEREHVTPYIWNHETIFKIDKITAQNDDPELSHVRLSVDRAEDLELVRRIWAAGAALTDFGIKDIARILKENPEWLTLNATSVRNEGYLKSIREDELQELSKRPIEKNKN